MAELAQVVLLALLPGAGNFAGGLVAEAVPRSSRWLNWALHAAAGVVLAVVAVEIMPEALQSLSAVALATTFFTGGLLYLAAEWLVDSRLARPGQGRVWMIYLAVATDLFGDGLMIGAGTSVSFGLAVTLALGQVLADIPEGLAAIFTFRANDIPRRRRLLLSASFFLPTVVGAVIAYLALRGRAPSLQYGALVATAGLFTVAALEDMIKEAHEADEDSRRSTLALISGFAIFVLASGGLG